MNGAFYLSFALKILSYAVFFIILFLSSNILTEDAEHKSLTNSYPISFDEKMTAKLLIHVIYSFLMLIGTLLLSTGIISVWKGGGNFRYPVVLFMNNGFKGIPVYQYALIFALYLLLLIIQVVLLSVLLNMTLKNSYLTLFIGSAIYFAPALLPSVFSFLFFLPSNFYNMGAVLEGTLSMATDQPHFNYTIGFWVLLLWNLILLAALGWYTRAQKRSSYKELKEVTV